MNLNRLLPILGFLVALPAAAELQLVSSESFGPNHAANGNSSLGTTTPDQRFVLITTLADNLAPGVIDDNGLEDVYLLDRQSGTYELISRSHVDPLLAADGNSAGSLISDDGRFVVFASWAQDLIAGLIYAGEFGSQYDTYLYDRQSGTMELVSHSEASAVTTADRFSTPKALSSDGRFVAFDSTATNLVAGAAGNTFNQVYLYDRTTGTSVLVTDSAAAAGTPANANSIARDISADGRYLLLNSQASNLVAGVTDSAGTNDVFVFDRVGNSIELISRNAANPLQALGGSGTEMSTDGRFVSLRTDVLLQAGITDGNGAGSADCFVFDRQSGLARLASRSAAAATISGNDHSFCGPLADNGDTYFQSSATNLVTGFVDNNGSFNSDLYHYDRAADTVTLVSHAAGSSQQGANGRVQFATGSTNGRYAAFQSLATNLQNSVTDTNSDDDIFLFDRNDQSVVLASRGPGNTTLFGFLYTQRVGGDGSVFFSTQRPLDATAIDSHPNTIDVFRFAGSTIRLESRAGFSGRTTTGDPLGLIQASRVTNNGRWVSWANSLYSRSTGTNVTIGHAAGDPGTPPNDVVHARYSSPDGRYVTLASAATNLVAGIVDEASTQDLYLYDRTLATTTLLTHEPGSPLVTNGREAEALWVSDDSRLFLMRTDTGTDGTNLYLYDRVPQTSELIDHAFTSTTVAGDHGSEHAWLSSDRSVAVVASRSWNLVAGYVDHNDFFFEEGGFWVRPTELYHFDRVTRQTRLITRQAGTTADGPEVGYQGFDIANSYRATPSGQDVFYTHPSDLLVTGQVATAEDYDNLFHWNRTTGLNQLVLHAPGQPAAPPCSGHTRLTDISPDGRFVLFNSECSLVAGDTNGVFDAYLLDRSLQQVRLISHAVNDTATAAGGLAVDLSDDASRIVVHLADAPHLYFPATATRRLLTPAHSDPMIGVPATVLGATPDLSGVLLATDDNRLAPNDGNQGQDLFLFTLDELFADGFEGGNTTRWSTTLP